MAVDCLEDTNPVLVEVGHVQFGVHLSESGEVFFGERTLPEFGLWVAEKHAAPQRSMVAGVAEPVDRVRADVSVYRWR